MDVVTLSSPSDLEEGPIRGRLSWSPDEPRSDSDLAFFRGREGPEGSADEGKLLSTGTILRDSLAAAEGPDELPAPGPIGAIRVAGVGVGV